MPRRVPGGNRRGRSVLEHLLAPDLNERCFKLATANVYGNDSTEKLDFCDADSRVGRFLDATYQIEAMVDALISAAHDRKDGLPSLVRGIGARILELNSIIMFALVDANETESGLESRLFAGSKVVAHHG